MYSTRAKRTRVIRVQPTKRYRRRRDTLTGGTMDVNPQWFKGSMTVTANTCAESNFQLPITRIPTSGKVTIVEVLGVRAMIKADTDLTVAANWQVSFAFATSSVGTTPVYLDSPAVFAYMRFLGNSDAGASPTHGVHEQDLTDKAGHGVLVASDKLYVQYDGTNAAGTSVAFELLYRFKTVGMREYVGIVSSQQ